MEETAPPAAVERFLREAEQSGYDVALVIMVKKVHVQNTNPMKFHGGEVEVFPFARISDAYLRDSVVRAALRVAREKLVARVAGARSGDGADGKQA